jgi:hypothetical protein
MLSANYLHFQKNSYRSVSLQSTSTANTYITEATNYNRGIELLNALECIVKLESKYFSHKDTQSTELPISNIINEAICALDQENLSSNTILRHVLENSKVLGLTVPRIDFLIDMLRTVVKLELKYITTLKGTESSQVISDLELLITGTYTRLKSVIGSSKIRDEFIFSLSLLYPSDKARSLVDYFRTEDSFSVDLNKIKREKDSIKSNIKNFIDAPEILVTSETTELDFLDLYKTSCIHFDSIKKVNEEIKDLKNKLRKNKVSTLSIQKSYARSLRILLSENPKQTKPKKIRIRKSKKITETVDEDFDFEDLEEDFDFEDLEETNDSDSE